MGQGGFSITAHQETKRGFTPPPVQVPPVLEHSICQKYPCKDPLPPLTLTCHLWVTPSDCVTTPCPTPGYRVGFTSADNPACPDDIVGWRGLVFFNSTISFTFLAGIPLYRRAPHSPCPHTPLFVHGYNAFSLLVFDAQIVLFGSLDPLQASSMSLRHTAVTLGVHSSLWNHSLLQALPALSTDPWSRPHHNGALSPLRAYGKLLKLLPGTRWCAYSHNLNFSKTEEGTGLPPVGIPPSVRLRKHVVKADVL